MVVNDNNNNAHVDATNKYDENIINAEDVELDNNALDPSAHVTRAKKQ